MCITSRILMVCLLKRMLLSTKSNGSPGHPTTMNYYGIGSPCWIQSCAVIFRIRLVVFGFKIIRTNGHDGNKFMLHDTRDGAYISWHVPWPDPSDTRCVQRLVTVAKARRVPSLRQATLIPNTPG